MNPSQYTPASGSGDAVAAKSRFYLKRFTDWLAANNVRGLIGENGWPGSANPGTDPIPGSGTGAKYDKRWDAVGQQWYIDVNAAKLDVTNWVASEWNVDLRSYRNGDGNNGELFINTTVATILEQNKSTADYIRGVNYAGAEFADRGPSGSLDLAAPGYGYYYPDDLGSFTFLKSRGVDLVRFPIRWERWQHSLMGPLDNNELLLMDNFMELARQANVKVLIDMHNYGRYDTTPTGANANGVVNLGQNVPNTGTSMKTAFNDFWTKVAQRYKNHPALWGYGLCNEPYGLDGGVDTWKEASRQATEAIRLVDTTHIITVGGYFYSTVPGWVEQNGTTAWLTETIPAGQPGAGQPRNTDPLIRFEGHHYWDTNFNGGFEDSYDQELSSAQNEGFKAYATAGYVSPTTGTGWPNQSKTDYRQVYVTTVDSPTEFQVITPANNTFVLPDAGAGQNNSNAFTVVGSTTSNATTIAKDFSGTGGARQLNIAMKIPTGQVLPDPAFPYTFIHTWTLNYQNDAIEIGFAGVGTKIAFALKNAAGATMNTAKTYDVGVYHKLTIKLTDTAYELYVDDKATPDAVVAASLTNVVLGAYAAGKFYGTNYNGPMSIDNISAGRQATYDAPADSKRSDEAPSGTPTTPVIPPTPTNGKTNGILIGFGG